MMPSLSAWPPTLYVITDIARGGASGENVAKVAEAVRKETSPAELTLLFQLRDKETSARALFDTAHSWIKALLPHQAFLLINERTDVAIATGAAGVHLGRGSYPIAAARELLPEGIIAWSAHSPGEVSEAARQGADLVTLSPIFESPGKGAPLGVGTLSGTVRENHGLPVLALGGASVQYLEQLAASGAAGVAVIGAVWNAMDQAAAARKLAAGMKQYWKSPAPKEPVKNG